MGQRGWHQIENPIKTKQIARVRRYLLEGPATSYEMSAVLCIPIRKVEVAINRLRWRGHATATGKTVMLPETSRRYKLYKLTEYGIAATNAYAAKIMHKRYLAQL